MENNNFKELWQKATTVYENGDYLSSAELYKKLANDDPSQWKALYNAGNSYYKASDLSLAIQNYWPAYLKNPRNPHLRKNLNLALSRAGDSLSPEGVPPALYRAANYFVWEEWAFVALALWLVFGFSSWFYFFKNRNRAFKKILWCSVIMLALSLLGLAYTRTNSQSQWLVLQSPGLLRAGPTDNLPVTTQVPEGRIVKVLKKQGDWLYIQTRKESFLGWIRLAN